MNRKVPQRRLTFATASDQYPVWSHDGQQIYYTSAGPGGWGIFRRTVDGTGEPERMTTFDTAMFATAITPDGQTLIAHVVTPTNAWPQGIYAIPTGKNGKPELLISGREGNATNAHLTTDGKWIAYQLEKGTRSEIIVHPFPNVAGGRWQVSDWGSHPLFSRSGEELFYRDRDRRLVSVKVHVTPRVTFDAPTVVVENAFLPGPGRPYDVSPDGQRFIIVNEARAELNGGPPPQLQFVLNWTERVKSMLQPR